MSLLPYMGAYVVVSLDPVLSLERIDDDIVREQGSAMQCSRYVAAATWEVHPLGAFTPQRTFIWDFVVQGLPIQDPDSCFEPYMTVPILPNTLHPESRRPVETLPPLPWNDCYHTRIHRLEAKCKTLDSAIDPQSCFSPSEGPVIDSYLQCDQAYADLLERSKAEKTDSPPPHIVTAGTLSMIRVANRRRRTDGKPWWMVTREAARAASEQAAVGLAATGSTPKDDTTVTSSLDPPFAAIRNQTPRAVDAADGGLGEGAEESHNDNADAARRRDLPVNAGRNFDARVDGDSSSSSSNFKDVIAGILLGLNAAEDDLPWLHVESYDIKQFEAPPDPTGFFEELKELERIKSDYIERQKQRLEEVKQQDAAYMATLAAHGQALSGMSRGRAFVARVKKTSARPMRKTAGFLRKRLVRRGGKPDGNAAAQEGAVKGRLASTMHAFLLRKVFLEA
ncbi:hypothetical protein BD626DRAFT_576119 [Schizophyllum amplum]|uniref:Uncharacterized protein n=1 Tax=Schizophyllum amplum TaxID=97359 RepID=A0A550BU90_9AGAR|nr:hypothetical protein BD626DRAFT_576119 [Auriculariopsis ampla]